MNKAKDLQSVLCSRCLTKSTLHGPRVCRVAIARWREGLIILLIGRWLRVDVQRQVVQ